MTSVFFGIDFLESGTDLDAPYLQGRNPAPGEINVALASNVQLEVIDDVSDVDPAATIIEMDRGAGYETVFTGGVAQPGFAATVTPLTHGVGLHYFRYLIDPAVDFAVGTVVSMRVTMADILGNTQTQTYLFNIVALVAPVLTEQIPAPGTYAGPRTSVHFKVHTPLGLGVDLATLRFWANGQPVFASGLFQIGFRGTVTPISLGYEVEFWANAPYPEALVDIRVYADSNFPVATLDTTWQFLATWGADPSEWGFLRGWSSSVGQALGEAGGLRATRLTDAVAIGDTSIPVESTHGWPTAGRLGIDGIAYRYTGKTELTITGLGHYEDGILVAGAKAIHAEVSTVLDLSRQYSALDQARRSLLVDYATDTDLDVVGRNLGVLRALGVADADLREIIKVLAYAPKGTIWTIERLLTAILGAGNFEIYEDLIDHPNVVYIRLPSALIESGSPVGKAYLEGEELRPAATDTSVVLTAAPLSVEGVRWKDEAVDTDCRTAKPSTAFEVEYPGQTLPGTQLWTFVGANETADVLVLTADGGCIEFQGVAPNSYKHLARLQPESVAEFSAVLAIPTGTTLDPLDARQCCGALHDTARALAWGIRSTNRLSFVNVTTGAVIGGYVSLTTGRYYEVTLRKTGLGLVQLLLDGAVVSESIYTAFPTSALHKVEFGDVSPGVSAIPYQRYRGVYLAAHTATDYWGTRGLAGATAAANPDRFDSGAPGTFAVGDPGKALSLTGATALNTQGGTQNGSYTIRTRISDQVVALDGLAGTGADLDGIAHPKRIALPDAQLHYPDDLGKQIVLSGSALGNGGTFVIEKLLQQGSLVDLATFSTPVPEDTNVCEVVAATFVAELNLDWQLLPVFVNDSGISWELSAAGSLAGATATLRAALPITTPAYTRVLRVGASSTPTAQLLHDGEVENGPNGPGWLYYPFYLSDPWHFLMYYLDDLTVAGVLPEIEFTL